ncbi:transporter [uncultured Kordia sp.]|uniref:transporter n=1 Tax=uncultured Kordia sp. TaxID=507699 RepID=UPI002633722B|nr:transporter [uncultured Kordia sp.]
MWKQVIKISCFILIFSNCYFISAQGIISGFYNKKAETTLVVGAGFEDSKSYFIGKEKSDLSRNLYSISVFGIYGINERLNIQASLPYLSSNKQNGLQDAQFVLKYKAVQKAWKTDKLELSFATGFSFNVGNYNLGGLNDLGQQAKILETRALVHYQKKSGWFINLQSGFSFKFEEVPNSLPVTFKLGKASAKSYFDFWYDFQHAFGGINYLETPAPQNFKRFGASYHKVGGTYHFPISKKSGIYIAPSYVITGRNVFQGFAYHVGWTYQM